MTTKTASWDDDLPQGGLTDAIHRSLLTDTERSVNAILAAVEDDPVAARRAGISEELVNLACGLDWSHRSAEAPDLGLVYCLTRITAIGRFLAGGRRSQGVEYPQWQ